MGAWGGEESSLHEKKEGELSLDVTNPNHGFCASALPSTMPLHPALGPGSALKDQVRVPEWCLWRWGYQATVGSKGHLGFPSCFLLPPSGQMPRLRRSVMEKLDSEPLNSSGFGWFTTGGE